MNLFETWQVIIGCIQSGILLATFLGALYVGFKANEINDRLRILQDYTAVSVIPGEDRIKLLNVGKVNLYLYGFQMPGNSHYFERARLLSAGTGDSAYYWIGPPNIHVIQNNKFDIKLYLIDEFGIKWISESGGRLDGNSIIIWTYRTYKKDWTLETYEKE